MSQLRSNFWILFSISSLYFSSGQWNTWSTGGGTPGTATPAPPQNTAQPVPSVVPGDGCSFEGQFLPVPGDQCSYYVCVVGGVVEPWANGNNQYSLARQRVPCAPGSGVPSGYTGGSTNPCEARPGACIPPKAASTPAPGTGGTPSPGSSWSATPQPSWSAPSWSATPQPTSAPSWSATPQPSWAAPQPSWAAPQPSWAAQQSWASNQPYQSPPVQNAQQQLLQAWGDMQQSMKQLFSHIGKK